MSYGRWIRIVKMMCCDCELLDGESKTVHCENSDGYMRCEVCGRVKE